ncbi:hypothetical protein ACFX13_001614 [Malus domestica]
MRLPQVLASALSDNFTSPIKPRLGNIVGVIKPSVSRADSGKVFGRGSSEVRRSDPILLSGSSGSSSPTGSSRSNPVLLRWSC